MEQLILFAIIAIVSSIFGKSKNKKPQKPMPPFNNKDTRVESPIQEETPQRHQRPQSFEDFAREFIGDWIPENSRSSNRESRGRLAAEKKEVQSVGSHSTLQLPQSKNDLMQAIVMAEILGPPKSKRK